MTTILLCTGFAITIFIKDCLFQKMIKSQDNMIKFLLDTMIELAEQFSALGESRPDKEEIEKLIIEKIMNDKEVK